MHTQPTPVLEIRSLSLAYPGNHREMIQALAGISLAILPGEICGVIGAPGAGKTSLLRAAAGRAESYSGEVLICGERLPGGQQRTVRAWLQGDPQPDPSSELLSAAGSQHAGPVRDLAAVLGIEEYLRAPFSVLPQTSRTERA